MSRIDEERREARMRRIPESLHSDFRNEPIVHHALNLYLNGTVELEEALAMAVTSLSAVLRQTRDLVLSQSLNLPNLEIHRAMTECQRPEL